MEAFKVVPKVEPSWTLSGLIAKDYPDARPL